MGHYKYYSLQIKQIEKLPLILYIHNDKVMTDKTDIANAFNAYFTNTVKTSMPALNTPSNKTFKHYMNEEHTH